MPTINYGLQLSGGCNVSDSGGVAFTESVIHNPYYLATGSANISISFGSVTTASAIYVKGDQQLTARINSNVGTAITVLSGKPVFLSGTSATALYLTNASGTDANVYIFIGGV